MSAGAETPGDNEIDYLSIFEDDELNTYISGWGLYGSLVIFQARVEEDLENDTAGQILGMILMAALNKPEDLNDYELDLLNEVKQDIRDRVQTVTKMSRDEWNNYEWLIFKSSLWIEDFSANSVDELIEQIDEEDSSEEPSAIGSADWLEGGLVDNDDTESGEGGLWEGAIEDAFAEVERGAFQNFKRRLIELMYPDHYEEIYGAD
jgi:hypothetical protein